MVSIYKNCQNCGKKLPGDSTWRKKFCNDNCRVAFHRKPTPQDLYAEGVSVLEKFKKTAKKERIQAIDSLYALKVILDDTLRELGDAEQIAKAEMLEQMLRKRNF